ncbi:MAG: cell shape determination protein CcmA [Bacteroidetes bacterium]|nr:cell shape determination protein CcmA [Bacteroidota bacterium]
MNMAKTNGLDTPSRNSLGNGTTVKGEIESNGDFRIDGTLIGTIKTKGKVVIGSTGTVDGEIYCQNADIEGEAKAQIQVKELLTIKSNAKITGDISTGKLAIESGAQFSGTCKMGAEVKENVKVPILN